MNCRYCLLAAVLAVGAATDAIPRVEIAPGVEMPLLGLGTGPPYTPNETYTAARHAFSIGYRAIDTAWNYNNQAAIARALRDAGVPRDEVFITSKVPGSASAADTLAAAATCLQDLRTTYVDLLLVHFPCPSHPYNESAGSRAARQAQWRAMEEIHRAGAARAIGTSHFCERHMRDILDVASVPIAANQVEYHVGMRGGADSQAWMRAQNITLLSFLPLCGQCDGDDRTALINGSLVSRIGAKHGKSGAQVSIRWLIQSGVPAIPRSKNPDYAAQDLDVFDFELDAADMAALDAATTPAAADGPSDDCAIP